MIIASLAFYLFSAIAIACGFMVIAARNPVHSVLFLILAFLNSAGLFVLMGAEFLAMILVIVYVGAVAVLFLFVVMMLDINFVELRQGFLQYLPIGGLVGLVLLIELLLVIGAWVWAPDMAGRAAAPIRSKSRRSSPARASEQGAGVSGAGNRLEPLSDGRGDPVHDRRLRHLPQPKERHHHSNVD